MCWSVTGSGVFQLQASCTVVRLGWGGVFKGCACCTPCGLQHTQLTGAPANGTSPPACAGSSGPTCSSSSPALLQGEGEAAAAARWCLETHAAWQANWAGGGAHNKHLADTDGKQPHLHTKQTRYLPPGQAAPALTAFSAAVQHELDGLGHSACNHGCVAGGQCQGGHGEQAARGLGWVLVKQRAVLHIGNRNGSSGRVAAGVR